MAQQCPYCASEVAPEALVCPNCSRDVVIPETLRLEHEELLRKRDRLRAELAEAKAQLAARRSRLLLRARGGP